MIFGHQEIIGAPSPKYGLSDLIFYSANVESGMRIGWMCLPFVRYLTNFTFAVLA